MDEVIFGCPGSGKTTYIVKSTLLHKCEKGLYLSFGRQNSLATARRLPEHMEAMSFHTLAKKQLGIPSSRIIDKMTMSTMGAILSTLSLRDKCSDLKILEATTLFYELFIKTDVNVNQVHSLFNRSTQIPPLDKKEKSIVVQLFKAVWEAQSSNGSEIHISHDGYLKLFSLSTVRLPHKYIYIDEAQDMDDVMHAIVDNMKRCNAESFFTMLGDPCQQIFGFRRASSRFGMMASTKRLNYSYRFGKKIAAEANLFMQEQNLPYFTEIEAGERDDTVIHGSSFSAIVKRVKASERITFITKHNATVWSALARFAQQGVSCAINGSINREEISRIKALHALFLGKPQKVYRNVSFERVKSKMELTHNYDGVLMCRFIESFSPVYPEIVENLEKYIVKPNKAHVFLSTTHQAKGLEFKHVVLANDFSKMYDREKGKYVKLPNHKTEDAHVFFTAMTRAKLSLTMPISDDEE